MEINNADVAELVDARDLKSLDGNVVWVRVPPPAPTCPSYSVGPSDPFFCDKRRIVQRGQVGFSGRSNH